MAWNDLLDGLNSQVLAAFAPTEATTGAVDQVIYTPVAGTPFPITMLPLDPLRLEGITPGTFTLRWARQSDFDAQGIVPQQGDLLDIDGTTFVAEQIQADLGGGVKIMLKKADQ